MLSHHEGLYSAFMPHPSLSLRADLKVVGFAFYDRGPVSRVGQSVKRA